MVYSLCGGRSPRACSSTAFLGSIGSALPGRLEDPCPGSLGCPCPLPRGGAPRVWGRLGPPGICICGSSFSLFKILLIYLFESEQREHKQGWAGADRGGSRLPAAESQDPKTRTWTEGRRFAQGAPQAPPPFSALAAPSGDSETPRIPVRLLPGSQLPRDFVQGTVPAGALPGGHPRRRRLQDRARSGTVLGPGSPRPGWGTGWPVLPAAAGLLRAPCGSPDVVCVLGGAALASQSGVPAPRWEKPPSL